MSTGNEIALLLQPEHETSQSREVCPSITLLSHGPCTPADLPHSVR